MSNPRLKAALQYAAQGFYVFPVPPGEKKSYKSARFSNGEPWGRTCDEVEIRRDWMRWPQANVGIVTGPESGFWVAELDTPAGHNVDGFASMAALEAAHGALPDTRQVLSPSGSKHFYFRWPAVGSIKNSASEIGAGIDVRGEGGMVLAPPSLRPGKGEYTWINKNRILDAPTWLLELAIDKEHAATERMYAGNTRASIELVAAAVAVIPNDAGIGWSEWNRVGMAIWAATSGHDKGFEAFDAWSQKWSVDGGYDSGAVKARWEAYSSSPPTQISVGTVFYLASEAAPNWRIDYETARAAAGKGLPIIRIESGELSSVATASEAALLHAGVPFYQRGSVLVRPVVSVVDAAHGRQTAVAQFREVGPVYLRDVLNRHTDFRKYDGRTKEWKVCNPPPEIAATVLDRSGEWKFPVVSGVISTPTMRPDGSILDIPGYDTETHLLLVEPPPMPEILAAPTQEDAASALVLLRELLDEFAFPEDDNGVAQAVALSALITPVVRGAFPVAPMHVARAPVAASGKSYLFDIAAAISIGQVMPVMAAGRTEEETEKRLGAALLAGQPLISIDNVNGEIYGDALCQIIERPVVEIRILGKSERMRIESRGTTIFCTGNNVILVGDLCRRAVTITLDPRVERPELREFKGDPVARVLDDRGSYIAAALTICRAYIVAGRPGIAKRLASFGGWSDVVRSALIWLGEADPLDSMELARAEDPELTVLREMLQLWARTIGVGGAYRCTMAEVIDIIEQRAGDALKWPELNAAVQLAAGRRGPADARTLGNWARLRKDRVVAGLRLVSKVDPKGGSVWWVEGGNGGAQPGLSQPGGGQPEPPPHDEVPF